jgi:molybdate transport system substrate-binding protein
MKTFDRRMRAIAAVVGVASLFLADASAAELKVLAAVALPGVLNEVAPAYEKASGNNVELVYGLAADLRKRILEGEASDVVVLPRAMIEDLQKQDKLISDPVTDIGSTNVALAIRAGASRPDISSVDTFKQTLMAAKSIVYADPAKGGVSGVYFTRVLDKLGLAGELKSKTTLVPGAQAAEVVARGDAELGVAMASEIVPVNGAEMLGPLPGEFGSTFVYTAGIARGTRSLDVARTFVEFLKGPDAVSVLKAKGFEAK